MALQIARSVGPDWTHWTRDAGAIESARQQLGQAINQIMNSSARPVTASASSESGTPGSIAVPSERSRRRNDKGDGSRSVGRVYQRRSRTAVGNPIQWHERVRPAADPKWPPTWSSWMGLSRRTAPSIAARSFDPDARNPEPEANA